MIFTFEDKFTKEIPIGNSICGLQHKGKRPITVTLKYEELKSLLNNPAYTINNVLRSLYGN